MMMMMMMMIEKKTRSKKKKKKKKKEKDLSPRSLSRICSNIFANDGEAEEVLGAIVNVVNGVVVDGRPSFSSLFFWRLN